MTSTELVWKCGDSFLLYNKSNSKSMSSGWWEPLPWGQRPEFQSWPGGSEMSTVTSCLGLHCYCSHSGSERDLCRCPGFIPEDAGRQTSPFHGKSNRTVTGPWVYSCNKLNTRHSPCSERKYRVIQRGVSSANLWTTPILHKNHIFNICTHYIPSFLPPPFPQWVMNNFYTFLWRKDKKT